MKKEKLRKRYEQVVDEDALDEEEIRTRKLMRRLEKDGGGRSNERSYQEEQIK